MKKVIIIITSALLIGFSVKAEEYFAPGWFIGIKGGIQHTVGETGFGTLISPTASINVGYQFRPWVGLRADFSGWQGKGSVNLPGDDPFSNYKFNYLQLAFDATFNVIDIFEKQARKHIVNPYVFAGVGAFFGLNNKEALAFRDKGAYMPFTWDKTVSPMGRLGAGVDFKAGKRTMIGLEYTANMVADKMNSKKGTTCPMGNNNYFDFDYNHALMLSLKFALGDQGKHAEKYAASRAAAQAGKAGKSDAEIAAAAALASTAVAGCASLAANYVTAPSIEEYVSAQKAEEEKIAAEKAAADAAIAAAAAQAAAEKAAAEKAAADAAAAAAAAAAAQAMKTQHIFFELNKWVIRDSEQAKIDLLLQCLNADPSAKVFITGHADKATGNSRINRSLSEKRAKVVAEALTGKGIDKSRIISTFKGDTENPFSIPEQNRVSICVVE